MVPFLTTRVYYQCGGVEITCGCCYLTAKLPRASNDVKRLSRHKSARVKVYTYTTLFSAAHLFHGSLDIICFV
jgi:hypothetical protein